MKKYSIRANGENITFDSEEMKRQTVHALKQTGRFYVIGYDVDCRPEYDFDFDESINDTCCGTDYGTGEAVTDCEQCTQYGVSCGGIVPESEGL